MSAPSSVLFATVVLTCNEAGQASLAVRLGVTAQLVNAYIVMGRLDEARTTLNDVAPVEAAGALGAFGAYWHGVLDVIRGQRIDVEALRAKAEPYLQSAAARAFWVYDMEARQRRLAGDRDAERTLSERAVELALHSRVGTVIVLCAADAAFGAWLRGEDDLFNHYVDMVESHTTALERPGVELFLQAARGSLDAAHPGCEKLKSRAYAFLIAAGRACKEGRDAERFAWQALTAADRSGQPFAQILARVALGRLAHGGARWLHEARGIAARIDAPELARSLRALANGAHHGGMLTAFVRRFDGATAPEGVGTLEVRLLRGEVKVGERTVAFTNRELELIMSLAAAGGRMRRDELLERLWPESDHDDAQNSLRVHVTRARRRIGDRDAIIHDGDAYRLTPRARIDMEASAILREPVPHRRITAESGSGLLSFTRCWLLARSSAIPAGIGLPGSLRA